MATVGDTLYLKSGSPPMVVLAITEGGNPLLTWFSGGLPQRAEFPDSVLQVDDPSPAQQQTRNTKVAELAAAAAKA